MRPRLNHLWETLTSGYWFVPTVMVAGGALLAFGLVHLDRHIIGPKLAPGWLYSGGADSAKTLLSTIAGSVITVAGVVFSITIVALTQASSQFGPRLLRNFMRDTANQVVLGTFVATFVYCLLVLRTVHNQGQNQSEFVPEASVTLSVLLAVASIAVLIYFIHHVSASMQAPLVVASARADFERVVERTHADGRDHDSTSEVDVLPEGFDATASSIEADVEGYVQVLDHAKLMGAAERADVLVRLEYRPGDYVIRGNLLARAWPPERCDRRLAEQVNASFICGERTTPEQDVEHAVRQMVEVAVRALSPGTNDPFTAINCIDALGAALCSAVRHGLPARVRHGADGRVRIIMPETTFAGMADTALNQIRQYGRDSVGVMIRLLETIAACMGQMKTPGQRQVLMQHAEMVYRQSEATISEPHDREVVRQRWEMVTQALGHDGPGSTGRPRGDDSSRGGI